MASLGNKSYRDTQVAIYGYIQIVYHYISNNYHTHTFGSTQPHLHQGLSYALASSH